MKLLSDTRVVEALEKLKGEEYDNLPLLAHPQASNYTVDSAPSKKISKEAWAKFKDINTTVFEIITELAEPHILDWFSFKSFPSPKPNSPEVALTKLEWIKKFHKKSQIVQRVSFGRNNYRLRRLNNITPTFLLRALDIETFLIQCLLASESIQRGGLQSHLLTDFSSTLESTQIGYDKGRRKKSSASPIYNRQSLPHQCYSQYVKGREEAYSGGYKISKNTMHFDNKGTGKGHIGFTTESLHFFELLILPNSEFKKLYRKELGEEGEAFLWLVKKIWNHNRLAYVETLKNNVERKKFGPVAGYSKRINMVIGLTPDAISMSRKRIDDGVSIHKKVEDESEINGSSRYSEQNVSAELTAHSKATKHNIYKNRSYSKEVIESERDFGAQVGNLMVEEALKIKTELDNVKHLTLEQVRDLLGITNEINKVEELLEQVDIELWGGFQHCGETIIITSDITAMLLKGYIEHLRLELPKLFLDDKQKGQVAQKKLAYLSSIFDKFPTFMQYQGEAMLSEFEIPYPSLL
jgi:hypothetical protein